MAKPAKMLLNVPAIKADFPILQRKVRDRRLVYLDSAATSQKPKQVIDATTDFYSRYNANVHRAIYELGEEATREYEGAREKVAAFIGAKSPNEIVFTKSTTESLNLVAYGYGLKGKLQKGDEILGTVMEHHSNHVPWHFVKDHKGAVLKYVDVNDDGTLKMEQYDELLTKRTKIVTVALCSNVLGTINPVKEIAKRAHEVGAVCVVDAAQAAPHMPIDVQDLDADFLAFSGHKMLGPTGIGILHGKPEALEATERLLERRALSVRGWHPEHRGGNRPRGGGRLPDEPGDGVGPGARNGDHAICTGQDWTDQRRHDVRPEGRQEEGRRAGLHNRQRPSA